MLNYLAKRVGNDLIIQCHVNDLFNDLLGNNISMTYKRFFNLDVFPLNTQEDLERWYNESTNPELYCAK